MDNKIETRTISDVTIRRPREDAFEYKKNAVEGTMLNEGQKFHIAERVEYPHEGGIYVYYKGMPFPKKGFPYPEAVWQNDLVKRMTLTLIKTVSTKYLVIPAALVALFPWKWKMAIIRNVLFNWSRIADWIHRGNYLKDERYCNSVRSLKKILENSFSAAGFTEYDIIGIVPKGVAAMFEYDDAYRYRLEDIMTEASREALMTRPIREIRRLLKIFLQREKSPQVKSTGKAALYLLSAALLEPRIRKAFRAGISSLTSKEWSNLGLDNADRYHVLYWVDYDFLGRTNDERRKIFTDFHTFSKCCRFGVTEHKHRDGTFETYCKKCQKLCEWTQEFPPHVEVAPDGM